MSVKLDIKTVSEGNSREHWAKQAERHRLQKKLVFAALYSKIPMRQLLPCRVLLTRIAPRPLDEHDNLRTSFKYIVDMIAELLTGEHRAGRADSSKQITWEYAQEKGKAKEYAIKIQIYTK